MNKTRDAEGRKPRRVVAKISMQLGGNEAYSELPADYDGPTKMIYDGRTAVFPTQEIAISAAGAAIMLDIGGYSDVTLVAPAPDENITHQTVTDWICD